MIHGGNDMKKAVKVILCLLFLLSLCSCTQNKEAETIKEEETQEKTDSSGIPVLRITLEEGSEGFDKINASPDHSYECAGSLDILVPEGYKGMESVEGLELEYMRGRGNSTWLADKKPYKIKFDKKQDLFGFGANKHYVLLANAYDRTFLKNRLTAHIAEEMGMGSVMQGVNVDLYVNDEYLGNYLLSEQVRIGEGRIEIDELEDETEEPELWGGYLLSFTPWMDDPDENIFTTSRGLAFYNETPSFIPGEEDRGNEEQKDYIREYIQRCEDAIFDEDDRGYEELIDVTSAADYWLIQEFCQNADAFHTPSSYAYKKCFEADGTEGRLYFGPLWDFDRAWGDTGFFQSDPAYFNHVTHEWIDELRDREEFEELLKERWKILDQVLEETMKDGGIYDQWCQENRDSFIADSERWKDFYEQSDMSGDYDTLCKDLKDWINARRDWINENIDDIGRILVRITIRSDIEEEKTIKMRTSSFLFAELEVKEAEGYVFEGWFDEEGRPLEDNATAKEDRIIYARYRKE